MASIHHSKMSLPSAEPFSAFPDGFFNLNRVASALLDAYSDAGADAPPSASEVMDAARTHWLNRRRLRFDYGGRS